MRYKIPAKLAAHSPERIRSLIRSGKADILPFRDDQGRAVIVMPSGVNFDDMEGYTHRLFRPKESTK